MGKVKVIEVEREWWRFSTRRMGTETLICCNPDFIGQTGELTGFEVVVSDFILYQEVRLEDSVWLFNPEHLQEIP